MHITTSQPFDINAAFGQATQLYQDGRLSESKLIYQRILQKSPSHPGAQTMLGLILIQSGENAQAIKLLKASLKKDPGQFWALNALGVGYLNTRDYKQALFCFNRAINLKPDYVDAYFNLAKAQRALSRYQDAIESYGTCLRFNKQYADVYNNRGIIFLEDIQDFESALLDFERYIELAPNSYIGFFNIGNSLKALDRFEEAVEKYEHSIALNPLRSEVFFNKGTALHQISRFDEALDSYKQALNLRPDYIEALYHQGLTLYSLNRNEEALDSYKQALNLRPDYIEALYHQGLALCALNRNEEALDSYNSVLDLEPDNIFAYNNRGLTFYVIKRYQEALENYNRAILLNPKFIEAFKNRALLYAALRKFDNALLDYEVAISLNPNAADVYRDQGNLFKEMKRFDDALVSYDKAIALQSEASTFMNKALVLLVNKSFQEGWRLYDSRLDMQDFTIFTPAPSKRLYELHANHQLDTLLIYWEQGIGDVIMFASMLNEVIPFFAKLIVQVDKRMIPLFRRSFKGITFYPSDSIIDDSDYDYETPIGGLAQYLRHSVSSFSNALHPYFLADKEKSGILKDALCPKGNKLVGISWYSANEKLGEAKSVSLLDLAAALARENITLVSLQYGDVANEIHDLKLKTGIDVIQCPSVDNKNDIDGLASLVDACDLVVSISNTTVHLAGAIGKPVWVLLQYNSDWRWFLDSNDSLWYPSARLFRQDKIDDWGGLLDKVAESFLGFFRSHI